MFRLIALALCLLVAPASADPRVCAGLRDGAPPSLADYARSGQTDFEPDQPGAGYSATYKGDVGWLTVYFFDARLDAIDDDVLRGALAGAVEDMRAYGKQQGTTLRDVSFYRVNAENSIYAYFATAMSSENRSEFVATGEMNSCIVKLRFTGGPDFDASREVFFALMTALQLGYP